MRFRKFRHQRVFAQALCGHPCSSKFLCPLRYDEPQNRSARVWNVPSNQTPESSIWNCYLTIWIYTNVEGATIQIEHLALTARRERGSWAADGLAKRSLSKKRIKEEKSWERWRRRKRETHTACSLRERETKNRSHKNAVFVRSLQIAVFSLAGQTWTITTWVKRFIYVRKQTSIFPNNLSLYSFNLKITCIVPWKNNNSWLPGHIEPVYLHAISAICTVHCCHQVKLCTDPRQRASPLVYLPSAHGQCKHLRTSHTQQLCHIRSRARCHTVHM